MGGGARPRRPAGAARLPAAPACARAAARLRGEPPAPARGGGTREGRAEREDLRVPRGGAAHPCGGSDRRCGGEARARDGRRDRRRARRRERDPRSARGSARTLEGRPPRRRLLDRRRAEPTLPQDTRRGAGRAALEPGMTAIAATQARPRALAQESRLVPFFFFATAFCCTFAKVQWSAGGNLFLADLTCGGFLLFYSLDRLGRRSQPAPRAAAILIAFLLAFLLGFFNLETGQALDQFVKGLVKWLLHFGFLIAGLVYLSRKPLDFYW